MSVWDDLARYCIVLFTLTICQHSHHGVRTRPRQETFYNSISRFSCLKSQTQSHSSPPTSTQATGQLVAVQNNHPLALTVTAIPGEEGVPGPSSSPSSSSSTALHIPSTQDQGRGIRGAEEYIIEEIYLSIIFGILFLGHKTFILTRTWGGQCCQ